MIEFLKRHKDNILLGILVLYVISLGVVTLDELFDFGWFPTELEKQINVQIEKIKSDDPSLQEEGKMDILEDKGDFAVPQLIRLLDDEKELTRKNAIELLTKLTDQNFGEDIKAWKLWYRKNKDSF